MFLFKFLMYLFYSTGNIAFLPAEVEISYINKHIYMTTGNMQGSDCWWMQYGICRTCNHMKHDACSLQNAFILQAYVTSGNNKRSFLYLTTCTTNVSLCIYKNIHKEKVVQHFIQIVFKLLKSAGRNI